MDRITLREVRDSDLSLFFEFQREPEAVHMAAFGSRDPEDREAFDAHWARIRDDQSVLLRTIECEGEVVGTVCSYVLEDTPEISYWIGRRYWGTGIATRALNAFLEIQDRRPLRARAARDNLGSIRVLEKCGFRRKGSARGYARARGEEIDELDFVLLSGSPLESPFLRDADEAFRTATERFERLVAPLGSRRANWAPDPRQWSVAACIEHLVNASRSYFVHLGPALNEARARGLTGGTPPYGRGTWMGRILIGRLDPQRRKFQAMKAPRVFRPRMGEIDFTEVCDEFRAVRAEWAEILHRADGLDLGRIKIASPVSRFLKLTAAQAVTVHVMHEPRHLTQAERVTRHPEFPE